MSKKKVTAAEITEAQNTVAVINSSINNDRDLVNQLLGQIKMAKSFSRFADVISTAQLKHIKETKMYKALEGKNAHDIDGNEIANVGTWDGFCQAIGLSRSKVDEDIANLDTFGEEALKQLSFVGAGYRELRQFRKLPEDEKQALIEIAKRGDKTSFAELAEEIITNHTKEKEELTKQLEEKTASYDALSKVNEKKSKELDKANTSLEKLKKRIDVMTPEDMGEELRKEASQLVNEVELDIRGKFFSSLNALAEHQEVSAIDHSALMSGFVGQLLRAVNEVALNLDIKATPDSDPLPDFLRADAVAKAVAATEQAEKEANNE